MPVEAELAKGRLEDEGIQVFLGGDHAVSTFPGVLGRIQLQVLEADRARAERILAILAGETALDEDWESQAEDGAGVWVCSLCGDPVRAGLEVCPSCRTPREAIRGSSSDITPPSRAPTNRPQPADGVQRRDQLTPGPAAVVELPLEGDDLDLPPLETFLGDDLAGRAFRAALFGLLFVPFSLYSVWLLVRLGLFRGNLSAGGMRRFYAALLLNGVACLFWLSFFGRLLLL
jgi:hypothetical protein